MSLHRPRSSSGQRATPHLLGLQMHATAAMKLHLHRPITVRPFVHAFHLDLSGDPPSRRCIRLRAKNAKPRGTPSRTANTIFTVSAVRRRKKVAIVGVHPTLTFPPSLSELAQKTLARRQSGIFPLPLKRRRLVFPLIRVASRSPSKRHACVSVWTHRSPSWLQPCRLKEHSCATCCREERLGRRRLMKRAFTRKTATNEQLLSESPHF